MKRSIVVMMASLWMISQAGCIKEDDCNPKTVQSEQAEILAYASTNGITGTSHASGLYYQITNAGSGTTPNAASVVSVKYTGKLLDGTVFDQRTSAAVNVNLGQVIPGWQFGIPLISEGGSIRLIVPSSLAYGCRPNGPIPAHSILYFEIELVDVL